MVGKVYWCGDSGIIVFRFKVIGINDINILSYCIECVLEVEYVIDSVSIFYICSI